MNKRPEIGDTVIIRGIVCAFTDYPGGFRFCQDGGIASPVLDLSRISEVIPKPWEPKAGDRMRYNTGTFIYTIQAIFQDKVWVYWTNRYGNRCDTVINGFIKELYSLCAD